jgi:uncharacterized protein
MRPIRSLVYGGLGVVLHLGAVHSSALAQDQPAASSTGPYIETVGTGERRVPPDRASVLLMVETKAIAAADAANENAKIVAAVRDTLRKLGLDTAVTTASYSVSPYYEPRPMATSEQMRLAARTVLRIQLRRMDQTGRVIDAGLARGATGVQGIFFEASTAEEARRGALADAAVSARKDAEVLAKALGGSLGPLLSTSTGVNDPRRFNTLASVSVARAVSTEVQPNEIVVSASILARWRFIPDR